MKAALFIIFIIFVSIVLIGCESVGNGFESNSSASASAIPWNKPASWEGAGALGGLGFQGTH